MNMIALRPLVSIITPSYNAAGFLPETAASVFGQTFRDYEHIIADDCSTDNTRDIITALAARDTRVRPLLLPRNGGPVKARNAAIDEARGRYLAFLDADDLWLPGKLAHQVALMERTGCALSFTDYRHMSADGRLVGRMIRGPDAISLARHYSSRFFCCSAVMVNRELAPAFHFPPIAPAVRAEDFVAWANVLRDHGLALRCPADVVRYRLLPGSRSSSKLVASRSVWHLYRTVERLSLLKSAYYFSRFAIAASIKHLTARPVFRRADIDPSP